MSSSSSTSPRYDWDHFDRSIRARALELTCPQLLAHKGLVPAGKRGRARFKIRCPSPAHPDRTPSCSIRPKRWRCFGCGRKGDVLDLIGLLDGLDGFGDQLRAALRYQGLDYDQERQAFLDAERARCASPEPPLPWHPTPGCAPALGPDAPASRVQDSPSAASPPGHEGEAAPREVDPAQRHTLWERVLADLVLEPQAADYLASRGLSPQLARSVGLVSADYESWARAVEAAAAELGAELVESCGLRSRSGSPHPYLRWMLVLPCASATQLRGARFRRLSQDTTYEGVKYLSPVGASNRPGIPFVVGPGARTHRLWIVEGELDALSLAATGRYAWGIPGAHTWLEAWCPRLEAVEHLHLVEEAEAGASSAAADFVATIQDSLRDHFGSEWVDARVHLESIERDGRVDCNTLLACGELEDWCALREHQAPQLSSS